jgi:hypothetical protein
MPAICTIAALFIALCVGVLPAAADDEAPPAVHGISFDEWTAANARLANGAALATLLPILQSSESDWRDANAAFLKALQDGPAGGRLIQRYGQVFANPYAGRFGRPDPSLEIKAKLATFEDYARVQAQLSVGTRAGIDPQVILAENGLTVYEWSQESANWIRELAKEAEHPERGQNALRTQTMRIYELRFRKWYHLGSN